ncbi:anhydro-N-acetylmuramic acid kinase [Microterricola viridarii]|uniref:Anhydro-N-acetylmuramic acid kinase n=1 Tax=Microterricola viridarii TaxID=412690 RepID=A0A1H1QBN7_9MICO|nr:anhydro-N-acetylmuramic acid kinase [Microterricola viridarii]SDS20840.1 anhydro-N-acetylmuramic acid kinase [Microterricola viridarii]
MIILSLQSGTSADGIDVAVVEATTSGDRARPDLTLVSRWTRTLDWEPELRARILAYADGECLDAGAHTALTTEIGQGFAAAAATAVAECGLEPDLVVSHGQTVFHWVEDGRARGTLQLGEPAWIAEATGAPVLANLRAADIAAGGQGAPLMGLFDAAFFGPAVDVASLNLGGIANLQILRPDGSALAFDTGPANVLIDASVAEHTGGVLGFDRDGALAAAGTVHDGVLAALLEHPYLRQASPKSTGRETFTLAIVRSALATAGVRLELPDLIATLTRYTATSVADALRGSGPEVRTVVASGGGVLNPTLVRELADALARDGVRLRTSDELGIDPEFKESLLFAFLGFCSWHRIPVSLEHGIARIAGAISPAPNGFTLPAPLDGISRLSLAAAPHPTGEHRDD